VSALQQPPDARDRDIGKHRSNYVGRSRQCPPQHGPDGDPVRVHGTKVTVTHSRHSALRMAPARPRAASTPRQLHLLPEPLVATRQAITETSRRGVMGDQPAQHGIGLMDIAQIARTVQGVKARHNQARRVADVVQPRGGVQEIGVRAESGCQAACPRGDALDVRPAAGKGPLQKRPGEIFGP